MIRTYFLTTNRNTYWYVSYSQLCFPQTLAVCFFNQIYVEHLPPLRVLKEQAYLVLLHFAHTVFVFFFWQITSVWQPWMEQVCTHQFFQWHLLSFCHCFTFSNSHISFFIIIIFVIVISDLWCYCYKRLQLAEASHDN